MRDIEQYRYYHLKWWIVGRAKQTTNDMPAGTGTGRPVVFVHAFVAACC